MSKEQFILEQVISSTFDSEIASRRGNGEVRTDADEKRMSATIRAFEEGISRTYVSRAETLGRMNAALEENDQELAEFFSRELEDIDSDY